MTESLVDSQSNKARGAILVYWSDSLSANDPRLEIECSKISIPVVLIGTSQGLRLLADVSDNSKTIMASFITETAVDSSLPKYDTEMKEGGGQLQPKSRNPFSFRNQKKVGFHICRKLKTFLYDETGGKVRTYDIHKRPMWMRTVFTLIDNFENKV